MGSAVKEHENTWSCARVQGKSIGVLGLGRSGLSAARALRDSGAEVCVWDDRESVRTQTRLEGCALQPLFSDAAPTLDALLLSPGIPETHPMVVEARELAIPLVSDIAYFMEALGANRPTVIAVTGTNGKSTTATLLYHALKRMGKEVALGGNIGVPVFELPRLSQDGIYILELSSYQLALGLPLAFDVAILLEVTPNHLERHGTMAHYIAAKKRILENTARLRYVVASADSPIVRTMYADLSPQDIPVLGVSVKEGREGGFCFRSGVLEDRYGPAPLHLAVGDALRKNFAPETVACVYATLRGLGIAAEVILEAMKDFKGLPHRLAFVQHTDGIAYVDDSKATTVEAADFALRRLHGTHTLYWIGGGRLKQGSDLALLSASLKLVRHAFLIGEASAALASICQDVGVSHTVCSDLTDALAQAKTCAQRDAAETPCVLLSPGCESFDQFESFVARGNAFSEWVRSYA